MQSDGDHPKPACRVRGRPGRGGKLTRPRGGPRGAPPTPPGSTRRWEGWEDAAGAPRPARRLPARLPQAAGAFGYYQDASLYGHFGQGCVHTRIPFELRTGDGIAHYRSFVETRRRPCGVATAGRCPASTATASPAANCSQDVRPGSDPRFGRVKALFDPGNRMNPGRCPPEPAGLCIPPGAAGSRRSPYAFHYASDGGKFSRVRADRISEILDEDRIVLVAGFQGVSTDSRDVTTLGRGGSDTTAVALAAALRRRRLRDLHRRRRRLQRRPADRPRRAQAAVASYEEMLEMSASGAKVLQLRSVEYARNNGVRIHCRSSFEDGPGTLVVSEEETEEQTVEQPFVTAVTHSDGEARVTLTGVRDEPGVAGRIFTALAEAGINVDVIIQNEPVGDDALADLSFTVDRADLTAATDTIAALGGLSQGVRTDERIGKVSIVGAGMRSHPASPPRSSRCSAVRGSTSR